MNNSPMPHDFYYFEYGKHAALRKGDWKIVREKPDAPWQLFNLAEDLSESRDRAADFPDRLADLSEVFENQQESFK